MFVCVAAPICKHSFSFVKRCAENKLTETIFKMNNAIAAAQFKRSKMRESGIKLKHSSEVKESKWLKNRHTPTTTEVNLQSPWCQTFHFILSKNLKLYALYRTLTWASPNEHSVTIHFVASGSKKKWIRVYVCVFLTRWNYLVCPWWKINVCRVSSFVIFNHPNGWRLFHI